MLKNDVFKKNLVKFESNVETKPLEAVLWDFAWTNGRLCAFRQNQSRFFNMDTLSMIKVSLVPVAFENRVFYEMISYFVLCPK